MDGNNNGEREREVSSTDWKDTASGCLVLGVVFNLSCDLVFTSLSLCKLV
jgi:hypothetical protein